MIEIAKYEQGVTRVFALSMTDAEAQKLRDDPTHLADTLGVDALRASGVEVFRVADLGDMGLPGYLLEGVDAVPQTVERDRAKLAALDGWAMLLHSSAFGGKAMTLKTGPQITLIGTYTQQSDAKPDVPIESEAAKPYTGVPTDTPPQPAPKGPAGLMTLVGILVFLALVALWLLA